MKRLRSIAGLLVLCALLIPDPASAQGRTPFAVRAAAIEGGVYAPNLDFYADSENYLLEFPAGPIGQFHLEALLFELVTLRGSIGYWTQDAGEEIGLDDPVNARVHEASLRIVPITGTLYYSVSLMDVRPMIGAGITQNLIQRTFERERLNGEIPRETFEANARNYSYHVVGGIHSRLGGPVWFGLESRYVVGRYQEEAAGDVDLDGWQFVLSLRYHFSR